MPRNILERSLAFDENDDQSIQQSAATVNNEIQKRKIKIAKRKRKNILVENSQFKEEPANDLKPNYNTQSEKQQKNDSGGTLDVLAESTKNKKTDATKNERRITRSQKSHSDSNDTDSSDAVITKLSSNQVSKSSTNSEEAYRSSTSSSHEIEFNFPTRSDTHNDTTENVSNIEDDSVIFISSQDATESFDTKSTRLIKKSIIDLDSLEASVISISSQDGKETFDTESENFDNSNTVKDAFCHEQSAVFVSTDSTVPKLVDYSLSSTDTISDKQFSESMSSNLSQDETKQSSTSVKTPKKLIKETTFILETPSTKRKTTRRTRSTGFDINKRLSEHFSSLETDTPPLDTQKPSATNNKTSSRKTVPSSEKKNISVTKSVSKNTAGKSANKTLPRKNTPSTVTSNSTQSKAVKSLNFDKTPLRRSTRNTAIRFNDSSEETATPKNKVLCTPYQRINLNDFRTPGTPKMSDKKSSNKYKCTPYATSSNVVEESPSFNVTLRRRSKSNDDLSTTAKKRNVTFGENVTIIGDVVSPRTFRNKSVDNNVPSVSKLPSAIREAMACPWSAKKKTPNKDVASGSKSRSGMGDAMIPWNSSTKTPNKNVASGSKSRSGMGDAMIPWNSSTKTPNKNVASGSNSRSGMGDAMIPWNSRTKTPNKNVASGSNSRSGMGDAMIPWNSSTKTPKKDVASGSNSRSGMGDAMIPWNSRTKTPNKNIASTSKARSVRKEIPDFAAIHKKAFEQMESLNDHVKRVKERSQLLSSSVQKNKKMIPSAIPRRIESSKTRATNSSTGSVNQVPSFSASGFGNTFSMGYAKKPVKEKEIAKAIAKKLPPSGRPLKEKNREYVKGVRSNRRFDLLMESRLK